MIYPGIEVYRVAPENFSTKLQIAAIYTRVDSKILLLQNAHHKEEAGTWGVPAGKMELGENPLQGAIRELFEETGIADSHKCLRPVETLYMRKPTVDYVYHVFELLLSNIPEVLLSQEHSAFIWVSQEQVEAMPLMTGAQPALDVYYQLASK